MSLMRVPLGLSLAILLLSAPLAAETTEGEDLDLALRLAAMLQSARAVIAAEQDRINDPALGDKGLSGKAVLARATETYLERMGALPAPAAPDPREAAVMAAMDAAIVEVMDANAGSIDRAGVGFKGFVPAVFGRLVSESFSEKVGGLAAIKVTAPAELVRNRKARPDPWEAQVITDHLLSPGWERGAVYAAEAEVAGQPAFRVMVPEYYGQGCLSCHGAPKGELDITGYPKEGGTLGALGGVISITLIRQAGP